MAKTYRVPKWMEQIPSGTYTITELMQATKKSYQTLRAALTALDVASEVRKISPHVETKVLFFTWLGIEHYKSLQRPYYCKNCERLKKLGRLPR